MANAVYPKFKERIMGAGLDLTALDVRLILVDTGNYTYSAAHEFLSDVPSAARVAVSGALTGKSVTNGVFDAGDVTVSSVSGNTIEALILYQHTGTEGSSRLIAYLDTGITGVPFTPNGGNVNVVFDNGAARIFAL